MARCAALGTVRSMSPLRIVIAARDHGARAAIRAALDPTRTHVVGEATGRWRAGELVRGLAPDAVVADISVLTTNEFFLRAWGPVPRDTPIVAVGPDDPHLAGMLRAHGAA